MLEVEVKLRIHSLDEIRAKLEALGWTAGPRLFERNTVYDTPERKLAAEGKLLRIREIADKAILTVKLPTVDEGPYKVREEHNTEGEAPALERTVEALGFESTWRYEKHRTRHSKTNELGVIELDETPIGNFLELEGLPEWIDATAPALGFGREDYVTATYWDLFAEWRGQQANPPRDMVFKETA